MGNGVFAKEMGAGKVGPLGRGKTLGRGPREEIADRGWRKKGLKGFKRLIIALGYVDV